MEVQQTKTWKTDAQYASYDEALEHRDKILQEHALVKIRKASVKGRDIFRVKYWDPEKAPKRKKSKKHRSNATNN